MSSKKILGIDPGTGICGFGVVNFTTHKQPRMITAGVIATPAHTPLADRLLDIFDSLEGKTVCPVDHDSVSGA